jgi:hypothetical protein
MTLSVPNVDELIALLAEKMAISSVVGGWRTASRPRAQRIYVAGFPHGKKDG